jgi:hypothetical protein
LRGKDGAQAGQARAGVAHDVTPVRYHHGLLLAEAPGVHTCACPQEPSRQAPATANAQTTACRSRAPVMTLGRQRQPSGCLDPQAEATARDSTGGVLGMLAEVPPSGSRVPDR